MPSVPSPARRQAPTPPIDLLICDLDGTLVDTRDGIVDTLRATLVAAGYAPPHPTAIYPTIGLPLRDVFLRFLPERTGGDVADRLVDAYRARYREVVIPRTRAFPGVAPTLATCARAGLRLAIATSKAVRVARDTLTAAGLAECFELVLGVDSVERSKPAPDLVFLAARELGVEPARALVVGDTDHDVTMGRAAGARTCAVTYGVQSLAELLAAGPDYVVNSFGELLGIVLPERAG